MLAILVSTSRKESLIDFFMLYEPYLVPHLLGFAFLCLVYVTFLKDRKNLELIYLSLGCMIQTFLLKLLLNREKQHKIERELSLNLSIQVTKLSELNENLTSKSKTLVDDLDDKKILLIKNNQDMEIIKKQANNQSTFMDKILDENKSLRNQLKDYESLFGDVQKKKV